MYGAGACRSNQRSRLREVCEVSYRGKVADAGGTGRREWQWHEDRHVQERYVLPAMATRKAVVEMESARRCPEVRQEGESGSASTYQRYGRLNKAEWRGAESGEKARVLRRRLNSQRACVPQCAHVWPAAMRRYARPRSRMMENIACALVGAARGVGHRCELYMLLPTLPFLHAPWWSSESQDNSLVLSHLSCCPRKTPPPHASFRLPSTIP